MAGQVRGHGCINDGSSKRARRGEPSPPEDVRRGTPQGREMAKEAVNTRQISIRFACSTFFVSETCYRYQAKLGIELLFIQPGDPQQNAYIERYNRTVRYDWLSQNLFSSIEEVQAHATHCLWTYNNERPNMALGGITPKQKLALAD